MHASPRVFTRDLWKFTHAVLNRPCAETLMKIHQSGAALRGQMT